MKSYVGRKQYSRSLEEDLTSSSKRFDTLSTFCKLNYDEKAEEIPILLTYDALSFYTWTYSTCDSYDAIAGNMRDWYTSEDQRIRILCVWESLSFSEAIQEAPDKSRAEVARQRYFDLSHTE